MKIGSAWNFGLAAGDEILLGSPVFKGGGIKTNPQSARQAFPSETEYR